MAPMGRSRNNKRSSSSSSYTSTITTIAFIVVCVVGVWMLTSNFSISPPQTTNRASETTTDTSNEAQHIEVSDQKEQPIYEDNPGDLPVDAIKSDERKQEAVEAEGKGSDVQEQERGIQLEKQSQVSDDGGTSNEQTGQESSDSDGNQQDDGNANQNQESKSDETESSQDESQNQNSDGSSAVAGNQEQQQKQESESSSGVQESQNLKSFQQQQQLLLQEDEGGPQTTSSQESQNEQPQHNKQHKGEFEDKTTPGGKPNENQDSQKTTITDTDKIQETQQESQDDQSNGSQDTKTDGNKAIPKESKESKKSWSTQAAESENEKERRKDDESDGKESIYGYKWQLCNVTAGTDYIPCLDNEKALRQLHHTKHFEHRERHCPEEGPTCLVPAPEGYKRPITWPQSRDKIWYHNVPHTKLAEVKGHQNWVKVSGEFLTFPGGGTQFIHGALHYIEFLQQAEPNIAWGKRTRVILDVGCGVASFGGYLFERDVLAMSFAPKDEHEAQVQFALERGIPAISAVMGSQRLPFPSRVFDAVHCARCRVPWHLEGGRLLLELNRVLRPGGYFLWSATPVYQKLEEDVEIWEEMSKLTASMCWELVTIRKDKLNSIGAAIYRKPTNNDCYEQRKQNSPPMCKTDDDPNAAWYVPLQACMHRVPVDEWERGTRWPEEWPRRLQTPPYWLNRSQMGIYGKAAPQDFTRDYKHWKSVVNKSYMQGLGISWSNVRNVMDMRAVYGGFAAAVQDLKIWVINVVNVDSPDTLPIIYERGLFGIYHDWCESFSTYPRTYDLLHADHLFSKLKKRCKLEPVVAEVDRIVRPWGKLIVRDESAAIRQVENLLKSLHWEVHLTSSSSSKPHQPILLTAQKPHWRPQSFANSS